VTAILVLGRLPPDVFVVGISYFLSQQMRQTKNSTLRFFLPA
jgi:hypothetical protein